MDHSFSDNDRVTARYLFNSGNTGVTSAYTNPAADPTGYILAHQQYIYSFWTHIFGPTLVNDVRFNYGNRVAHTLTLGVGSDAVQNIGLKGVSNNAFPNIAPAGYSQLGSTNQERRQYPIQNYQYVDNLSGSSDGMRLSSASRPASLWIMRPIFPLPPALSHLQRCLPVRQATPPRAMDLRPCCSGFPPPSPNRKLT